MTTVHPSNAFNVETTLNQWFATELALIDRPAWLPNLPTFVYDMPEADLPTPCISFFHLPISDRSLWMGDATGEGERGLQSAALLDISLWASRLSVNWLAQVRTMRTMVQRLVTATPTVIIQDVWYDTSSGTDTSYKINFFDLEAGAVESDANPDIKRQRLLLRYEYVTRATI